MDDTVDQFFAVKSHPAFGLGIHTRTGSWLVYILSATRMKRHGIGRMRMRMRMRMRTTATTAALGCMLAWYHFDADYSERIER